MFKLVYDDRLIEPFDIALDIALFSRMPICCYSPLILHHLPARRAGSLETVVVEVMP